MAKSKKIFVGIKGESDSIELRDNKPAKCEAIKLVVEERVKPAQLISRLNFPESVKYGESTIHISPRAKMIIADEDKLGELPKGIVLKRI